MTDLNSVNEARWILIAGALFAVVAVIIGAFSAHALKTILDQYSLNILETGARYQMYHAFALLICGLLILTNTLPYDWIVRAAKTFIFGIFLFSGSLYCLALTSIKWFGAITPIGGTGFILAWCFLMVAVLKAKNQKQ
jgi:uncharacterized membrane protein YgdD (TMEM256/DUF423 family)